MEEVKGLKIKIMNKEEQLMEWKNHFADAEMVVTKLEKF